MLLLLLQVLHAQDEDESSLHLFICLAMHPAEKNKQEVASMLYVSAPGRVLLLLIAAGQSQVIRCGDLQLE